MLHEDSNLPFFKGVRYKQMCQIVQILAPKLFKLQIAVRAKLSFAFSPL